VQRERIGRRQIDALTFNADLMVGSTSADPEGLRDLLEEAIMRGQPDSARRIGAVVLGRLRALIDGKVAGAEEAFVVALGQFATFQKQHPSRLARLRAIDAEIAGFETPIRKRYEQARSHFKLGRHAQAVTLQTGRGARTRRNGERWSGGESGHLNWMVGKPATLLPNRHSLTQ
jgi:hypothetical protein